MDQNPVSTNPVVPAPTNPASTAAPANSNDTIAPDDPMSSPATSAPMTPPSDDSSMASPDGNNASSGDDTFVDSDTPLQVGKKSPMLKTSLLLFLVIHP